MLYVLQHAAEGRNACTSADKEMFLLLVLWHDENALRPAEGEGIADIDILEDVAGTNAAMQVNDDELDNIGAIGHGCDTVTAPALVALLVNGQIEGNELPWPETEVIGFGQFYPIPSGIGSSLFYTYHNSFLPSWNHRNKGILFCGSGV